MTTMTMDDTPGALAMGWFTALLKRLFGAALVAVSVYLAVALVGFEPSDPSINHAIVGPVSNPSGVIGAIIADLFLQIFGQASWIPVACAMIWGIRLLVNRPLNWPWLPVLALPLAIMAAAAFLAGLDVPNSDIWPFPAGLGGVVGDIVFVYAQPHVTNDLYMWIAGILTLLLVITSLGIRWHEGLWALGRLRGGTKKLGDAAAASGRAASNGVRAVRRRGRDINAPVLSRDTEANEGQSATSRVGGWVAGLASRVGRNIDDLEQQENQFDNQEDASQPARKGRRPIEIIDPLSSDEDEPIERQAPTLADSRRTKGKKPDVRQSELGLETYTLPNLNLLASVKNSGQQITKGTLAETSRQLETVLDDFGVRGEIIDAKPGPVVTLFELEAAPGTRAARVVSLADDIARSLCVISVRIAVVPGRNAIGIELPNEKRQTVYLRQLLDSDTFKRSEARLALSLGKDISGNPMIVDLARMPHLLIAGTTGSGKSVAINAMILSLLYRLTPEQCRIVMIDPKVIELSVYEDIPHLLAPVVTEPHKAVVALKWVVRQMDERYRLMSHLGVRDIFAYNRRIEQAKARGETLTRRVRVGFEAGTGQPIMEDQPIPMDPLPLIVVIVDEVADLMLTAGKEIENAIQRLSQKARAAGVHLIVATQRPSVDVLTGVIKANLPSRISFRVSTKIDSRTVLGEAGAEQLLGQGDMLYMMPGDRIARIHGPLVTDNEVERVVNHWKAQGEPDYVDEVTSEAMESGGYSEGDVAGSAASGNDPLYDQAVQIVARDRKASTSYLQRKLSIGYNSAAKLIERMEGEGLISGADHVGRRQVLMGQGGVDGDEPTDIDQ